MRWSEKISLTTLWALVVPVAIALFLSWAGLINALDKELYDRALQWRAFNRSVSSEPFVLIEIDDRSIDRLGRFPWSRSLFAELLTATRQGDARVVGLDVVFSEAADSAGDVAFANALRAAGNVILASAPLLSPDQSSVDDGVLGGLLAADAVLEPIPVLARAAAGVGSISVVEDEDGSMRRYSLLMRYRGSAYPSLAHLMAGVAAAGPSGGAPQTESVSGDGTILINYGSLSPEAVTRISFADVLDYTPAEARRIFADKIVLLGATYTGGVDYGPTPLDPQTPRVFAHIYAINTIISGKQLRALPEIVPFLLAGLMIGLLKTQIPARDPLQLWKMGGALVLVIAAGSFAAFFTVGVVLEPGFPVVATGLVLSGYSFEQWWSLNRHLGRRNEELQETVETLRRTRSIKDRMEAELHVARDIQFSMLQLDFPPRSDHARFELYATLVPAREVGGDFYDFFMLDDHHLCVCIADVSDKGVPAALFMAVSKTVFKSKASGNLSPGSVLSQANAELARGNDASMFVTVWLGFLDLRSGQVVFTNAGHLPPEILTSDGDLTPVESLQGPPVAVLEGLEYGEDVVRLDEGDTLLLYTDGIPEAMSPDGILYGEDRLRELVRTESSQSIEGLVATVADDVMSFQGHANRADDLTLLALRYHGDH